MKKLLIGMLIACSLGVVACGKNDTNKSANSNSDVGITDGKNPDEKTNETNSNGATNGTNATGTAEGTNGTGTTDGTNSNQNGTNNQGTSLNETKTSLNNLYTEFKGKVEGGVENITSEVWNKYSTEFKGKLTNLRGTVQDASMIGILDHMENLFNEYDTAIKGKTDVAKEKVTEMHKKIEEQLK